MDNVQRHESRPGADMSLIYVSTAQCPFLLFADILLNIHEDMRRNHWIPVAFMPIYDPEKSNRPTQGHKCDPVRAMRVYHDCCRHILGTWKDKTHNIRVVSLGNVSRHQVRSFLGRLVGDDARWSTGAYCASWYFTYYLLYCKLWYCLHINYFYEYIRSMRSSLPVARDHVYVIAGMQKRMIFCWIEIVEVELKTVEKGEGILNKQRRFRSTTKEILWCWLLIRHLWLRILVSYYYHTAVMVSTLSPKISCKGWRRYQEPWHPWNMLAYFTYNEPINI